MKTIQSLTLGLLLCLTALPLAAQQSPHLYGDAQLLHQIREDYAAFCQSIAAPEGHLLVRSPEVALSELDPHVINCVKNIIAASNSGVTPPESGSFTNSFNNPTPNLGGTATPDSTAMKRRMRQIIREWHYAEAFVMGPDKKVSDSAFLDLTNPSLTTDFPSRFEYLDQIAMQIRGAGENSSRVAEQTNGLLSGLTGGMPESEIIQGIVDWTIQRAKEELMHAFLQRWLDEIDASPVLQAAFPNTLNLLSSTDLSTTFSQGGTWKAAFQQDLDAIPNNLPQIVDRVLDQLPRKLDPAVQREVVGVVNVTSQLYLQLDRNQNNLSDAVRLISQSLMLQSAPLAYTERAVIGTEVLTNAVQTVRRNLPVVVTPESILNLGATELCDLWNVIYLRNRAEMARALDVKSDVLYERVTTKLAQFKLLLAQTADILQNVNDILDVGTNVSAGIVPDARRTAGNNRPRISFQEARAYYELVLELLNNSLELAALVHAPTDAMQATLNKVVAPIGEDVMDIAEGVATQQYGAVISNSISLLRTLSDEIVRDPKLKSDLETAETILILAEQLRQRVQSASEDGNRLKSETTQTLSAWLETAGATAEEELKVIVQEILNEIKAYGKAELEKVKVYLRRKLKQLEKELRDYIDGLDLGEGIDHLVDFFNRYGTLMVNILTATNSEDVSRALEEAATPVGSYMVKQTSKSSLTLTFLPGAAGGYEIPQATRDIFAAGGDTLNYGSGGYLGATLPIGLEWAFGTRTSVLGAVGIYGQVLDLGAVLNYRLSSPGDSVQVASDVTFRKVLSPGIGITLHGTKVPIVLGGRVSYSPQLRSITDGTASYQLNTLQIGGFIAVDVTVLQLFASRKKIVAKSSTYGRR
ncbi:MAG: hypothetical protein AAGN35_25790 [Bacteroidota bacterium]